MYMVVRDLVPRHFLGVFVVFETLLRTEMFASRVAIVMKILLVHTIAKMNVSGLFSGSFL